MPDIAIPSPSMPRGAGVALVTVFGTDGALLIDATVELAVALAQNGADHVLVCGTAGEFPVLSDEERVELFRAVRRGLPAHLPMTAHVGGVSAQRSAELASEAARVGANAILALPPREGDLMEFYGAVTAASSALPVLAYNLPQFGATVPLSDLQSLGLSAIKDSSGDGGRFVREVVDLGLTTFTGSDALLPLARELGAAGSMLASANIWPELCRDALLGDRSSYRELVTKSASLTSAPFPRAIKAAVSARWGVSPASRSAA